MKSVGIREMKDRLSGVLGAAQNESVLVMNHGQPEAIVIGIRGLDPETAVFAELHRRRMTPGRLTTEELMERRGITNRDLNAARRRMR